MDRLLARLERRFGRLAIDNVTVFLVAGMGLAYVAILLRPEVLYALVLDVDGIKHGQIWRLVTYLFIPQAGGSVFWFLMELYVLWLFGSSLEAEWGAFKLNLYYLVGMLGTTAAALVTGHAQSNTYLIASITMAFATLFPDFQMLIYFILPVRAKWIGIVAAGFVVVQASQGGVSAWAAAAAALGNYLLFFGGHLARLARGRAVIAQQAGRREDFRPAPEVVVAGTPMGQRECAICGSREADGADIRICSCEKCGGTPRTLCLAHARNH